jgi:hypothetical protein
MVLLFLRKNLQNASIFDYFGLFFIFFEITSRRRPYHVKVRSGM